MRLCKLLKNHKLLGEVMVRTLHASEMAILHTLPKLTSTQREVAIIVKCSGTHHKDLLHEMIDHFTEVELEVLHAEIDQENGEEVILFWLQHENEEKIQANERVALKQKIKKIYEHHGASSKVVIGGEEDEQTMKKLRSMRRVSKEQPDTVAPEVPPVVLASQLEPTGEGIVEHARKTREVRNSKEKMGIAETPSTTNVMPSVDSVSTVTVSVA